MQIRDDGKGFEIKEIKTGKGLKSIRERAQLLGAKLELGPGLNEKGFGLSLAVPARKPARS